MIKDDPRYQGAPLVIPGTWVPPEYAERLPPIPIPSANLRRAGIDPAAYAAQPFMRLARRITGFDPSKLKA